MIIVDTSVWVDHFNGKDTPETQILSTALSGHMVATGDLILLEVLQGFRSDQDYNIAKKYFETLEQFEMLGIDMALKAAENYRKLRKKGITIRKSADAIIASFCIQNAIPLLFSDKDFLPFVKHFKLQAI